MDKLQLTEKTLTGEIAGKNTAIHAYDKIIWQIRTGFLTLVFGGWAFIVKGAIESGRSIKQIEEFIIMMAILSIMLAIVGFVIDRNYVKRKFRVIKVLTKLQEILVEDGFEIANLSKLQREQIKPLIGVAGDSGNDNFKGKGFNQEILVSYLIYLIVFFCCILLLLYVILN